MTINGIKTKPPEPPSKAFDMRRIKLEAAQDAFSKLRPCDQQQVLDISSRLVGHIKGMGDQSQIELIAALGRLIIERDNAIRTSPSQAVE